MKVTAEHKKTKCPKCGSSEIHTQGLDQLCLDCDWDNSYLLIHLGQLDQPKIAAYEQFIAPKSFESLKDKAPVSTPQHICHGRSPKASA